MRVSSSDRSSPRRRSRGAGAFVTLLVCATVVAQGAVAAQSAQILKEQRAQYDAVRAKSIIELQPFRETVDAVVAETDQPVRLISLNPAVNAWFLLQIGADGSKRQQSYHLENPRPRSQTVALRGGDAPVLMIGSKPCAPWAGDPSPLAQARKSGLPYAPLCRGRMFVRNRVPGNRTTLERTTDFLRDYVFGGEQIVRFVKNNFYRDSEVEISRELAVEGQGRLAVGPGAALVDVVPQDRPVLATHTELTLAGTEPGQMTVGLWYPVQGLAGVYASAIQPRMISAAVMKGPGKTNRLDSLESRATDYMVAFDLARFTIGYSVGTDHPSLGWSPRPPRSVRPRGLPGPDGVRSARPLVALGMVSPALTDRTIATFTGGFKRSHGAFKYGDYATLNYGTHYGFIEQGVILSKLQPNLSTLYVLTDGTIGMKTWHEADNVLLPRIRFARQNGVPLLETDPATGQGVPGDRVTKWGPGNWSGSAEAVLRTLRAGACLRDNSGKTYLIYGYFSTATPSAMARTFQDYGCKYAMLLDMNALELTYMALYRRHDGKFEIEHLVPGMAVVDKKDRRGKAVARFLGYPDNRDMFYVMRREGLK